MSEVLFIVAMLGLVVAPWWIAKATRWWAYLWTGIAVLVIVVEIIAKVMTDRTISQQFWAFGVDNLTGAWLLVASMFASIVVLSWHLMVGVYKRRRKRK